jgi:hypothetical protein
LKAERRKKKEKIEFYLGFVKINNRKIKSLENL